jgi:lysophospholipase L1-like esterase
MTSGQSPPVVTSNPATMSDSSVPPQAVLASPLETPLEMPHPRHSPLSSAISSPMPPQPFDAPWSSQDPQLQSIQSPKPTPKPAPKPTPKPIAKPIARKTVKSAPKPTAQISTPIAPRTGGQLYRQRVAALSAGRIYTRMASNSFEPTWRNAPAFQPTYEQWHKLLKLESRAVSRRQSGHVSVMLGDSLSLWFPIARLPQSSIWLNQGISGETTQGVLARSGDVSAARPDTIYIMAGVNDLKRGLSDREIIQNLQRLCQRHAGIPIVIQSILPTRSAAIPNQRIARLNAWIEQLARQQGAYYLNVHQSLVASDGYIRSEYTTDGIHLSDRGYAVWQQALNRSEAVLAQVRRPNTIAAR